MKILITGATSGIGRQLALDYQAEGHQVWGVGRSADALETLVQRGITPLRVDLSERQAACACFSQLESLDLAILSAGTCEYIDMPDFNGDLFARVMRANVESMANSIEALLPALRKSSSAQLVGIGSSAAYLPLPRAEAYGSSKAAIAYLMKTLRITLKADNINVSLVCPGFVKTPLTDRNDFPMPFLIDVTEASRVIRKGIAKNQAEIHFPRRFTYMMKLMSLLPQKVWDTLAQRMIKT